MTNEDEIKDYLLSHDADFRRMAEEHSSYDQKLRALNGQGHVTNREQYEEVNLKKKKLYLKDQMSRRIQEYRHARAGH
jgi:uncharacterized protein YdcH (DUF465 family)